MSRDSDADSAVVAGYEVKVAPQEEVAGVRATEFLLDACDSNGRTRSC